MALPLRKFKPSKDLAKRSTEKYLEEALYIRLFKDGGSEKSVRLQLNKFIKSRKRVFKWEVGDTLKKLRDRKLYYPALKVRLTKPLKFCCNGSVFYSSYSWKGLFDRNSVSLNHCCSKISAIEKLRAR